MRATNQPRTPKTALVAATRVEMAPAVEAMGLRWRGEVAVGTFADKPIHVLLTGVGRSRARAKVANLLKQERFERVIHLGFAGALTGDLEAGQPLNVGQIIDEHGGRFGPEELEVCPYPFDLPEETDHTLVTADQAVHSGKDKAALGQKHQAHAVDMESFHVAALAHDAGVGYRPLRVISDGADLALPRGSVRWVNSDGSTNHRAVLGHLLRRPRDISLVRTLGRGAKLAADRLAHAVQAELRR